jgi:predicted transcriptional regulator
MLEMKKMKNIYYPKWMEIIEHTEKGDSLYGISKKTIITYSHIVKIVRELIELKYMKKELKGRKNYITLTKKGESIKENIIKIKYEVKK